MACRELKQDFCFAVILLTARDMEEEMVEGLEAGADDYVTKPFFLEVLKLRVKSILKRAGDKNIVCSHGISVNLDERRIFCQNEEISLGKTEYELFAFLLSNKNMVLTRDTIWEHIWGTKQKYVDDSSIFMLVSRLRGRLKNIAGGRSILKQCMGLGVCGKISKI